MAAPLECFRPIASVLVNAAATSAPVAVPGDADGQDTMVRLFNAGPSDVFVAFGMAGVTVAADGTGMILPVGSVEIFGIERRTHLATICPPGGSAQVYVTRGLGI